MYQRIPILSFVMAGFILMSCANPQPTLAKGKQTKHHSPVLSYSAAYDKFANGINMSHDDLVISVNSSSPIIVTITLHQKPMSEMKQIGLQFYKKYRALRLQYGLPVSASECRIIVEGPNIVTGPAIIIDENGSRVGP